MKTKIAGIAILVMSLPGCSKYLQDFPTNYCETTVSVNPDYSKASQIESALQDLVHTGIPGVSIAIYSEEGWWTSSAGYAKIEDQTLMLPCHLHYLQSISKTYMAVAVLKLAEEGKVELDAPFTLYLPERYSKYITDADKITVRMLLNHTSGIPEYNFAPAYVTKLLQHPDYPFVPEDYLKYIDGKPLDFEPGSKFSYRNTNYVILALMTDAITGDHAQFISDVIFEPLGLGETYYRNDPGYPDYPNLVNSYWDRYSNGIVENVSKMEKQNVSTLIGDDGIIASPVNAVKFLKGLMEGQLLNPSTMEQMKTWVFHKDGKPAYGLGLDISTFAGNTGMGHSGGGIGAGCQLYFFPEKNIYVFLTINLGTVTDSPIHKNAEKVLDQIYQVLLNE